MKIILDESAPQKLRLLIEGDHGYHDVVSRLVRPEERSTAQRGGRGGIRTFHHGGSGAELSAKSHWPVDRPAGLEHE